MSLLDVVAQKARVAGLVAAACAVTGIATAAAVAPSFTNVDSSTDVVATASPDPSATADASASPDASPTADAVVTTDATPAAAPAVSASATCPADVTNHGSYVSSVAKDHSTTGRDHGKAVSEAAHSDCGKKAGDSTDGTESPDSTDTESPEPAESADAPESPEADSPDATDASPSTTTGHGKGHTKAGHTG
jgi:hypothetical protein